MPNLYSSITGYTPVRVSVRAKTYDEAYEKAFNSLDLLRGFWNLHVNRRVGLRSSSGIRKPVNRIVLGPIHSLHKPSGELASEYPLIEPDYVGPLRPHRLNDIWEGIEAFKREVRGSLARIPYPSELEGALLRYVRALDRRDWNTSFVQLWGLLEYLTGTSRARYEVTEERALFLIRRSKRDFHRQIFGHLTGYRNRTVHAGYETEAIETLLFQLKRYVEIALMFHLGQAPRFDSIEEAASFMSLPPHLPDLRKREQLTRRAIEFQARV